VVPYRDANAISFSQALSRRRFGARCWPIRSALNPDPVQIQPAWRRSTEGFGTKHAGYRASSIKLRMVRSCAATSRRFLMARAP
jgi:hypothetical protein